MGYRLNRSDEPVLIAVSKTLLTELGIHHRLVGCKGHRILPYVRLGTYVKIRVRTCRILASKVRMHVSRMKLYDLKIIIENHPSSNK